MHSFLSAQCRKLKIEKVSLISILHLKDPEIYMLSSSISLFIPISAHTVTQSQEFRNLELCLYS